MHDIIIIGAGAAGMTAALYAARAGKSVLMFEGEVFGGQITYSPKVENYPSIISISGNAFADNLLEQVLALGVESEYARVTEIKSDKDFKTVEADGKQYSCKSVIIATGLKHKPLGLDKEKEFIGKGVSYCATCDGAFFKGKDVAIIGGGNSALQESMFLSAYCKNVYHIHHRDSFRGEKKLVNNLKEKSNIHIMLNTTITELLGDDQLTGIKINQKGLDSELPVEGLFVAVGHIPDNGPFENLIKLDEKGHVAANDNCHTSVKGIFAAGDCRVKDVRQLTTATADGTIAALEACKYIDSL